MAGLPLHWLPLSNPCATPPLPPLQFLKSVAGEYEELRQRQRKAMAEQMAIDAEMLQKMDAAHRSGLSHAVSGSDMKSNAVPLWLA